MPLKKDNKTTRTIPKISKFPYKALNSRTENINFLEKKSKSLKTLINAYPIS